MQYCRHGFKILKIIFFLEHKDIKNNRMDHQEIWHMRALNKLQIPLYEVGLPIYRFQHQYPHPHSVQDQAEMETRSQNTRNDLPIAMLFE